MSQVLSSLCLLITLLSIGSGYYIIETKLPQSRAESYCQSQCDSHLTSIINETDEESISYALLSTADPYINNNDTNTAWIGLRLYNDDNPTLNWTDGTNIDQSYYDNIRIIDSSNLLNQTDADICFTINERDKYHTSQCETNYLKPMCKSCASKLNKYILVSTDKANNSNQLQKLKLNISQFQR